MAVILREDVATLGTRGQVVKVASGYARNSLLPKRLAVAVGEDPHTIQAVGRAAKEGLVKAILTGDKAAIQKVFSR